MNNNFKVLLIGDTSKDVYQYGTVDRISPEAPVPVFKTSHFLTKDSMASNVLANLLAFGLEVDFVTGNRICTKTRIVDARSNQQILRIDDDVVSDPVTVNFKRLSKYNCIVISDYCKGAVTPELIIQLRDRFDGPIFVDTKQVDLQQFNGCFVKINNAERNRAVSLSDRTIVTLGDQGAQYNSLLFPAPQAEVVDVTGAGDTFLAALAWEYLNTDNIEMAIKFAVHAASMSVRHFGVYALTQEDIDAIKRYS